MRGFQRVTTLVFLLTLVVGTALPHAYGEGPDLAAARTVGTPPTALPGRAVGPAGTTGQDTRDAKVEPALPEAPVDRAPASQPGVRLALREDAVDSKGTRTVDLELRRLPKEEGPRFHGFKPFVEMLAYQSFLVASGWVYGNSPLDWDPPSWERWKYNVSHPMYWDDGDSWALNYGGHAIFGSDHYLMARNCGWSWYSSVAFNTFGSFFWEYFSEGIFEQPSVIDLVVTPTLGSLLGEGRYRLFRLVKKHADGTWYGYVAMAILDPTTMFFRMWGWE